MNNYTNEIWKDVKDYENYEVSNLGNVRNKTTEQVLIPYENYKGYLRVVLGGKNKSVHRLVAEAFIENPNNLDTVDHINGKITDNRADNLQWLSRGDNSRKSSLGKKRNCTFSKVACLETGKVYKSGAEAARQLGVYCQSVLGCCKGKQHSAINKISGEHFHFMYVNDYYDYLTAQLLEEIALEEKESVPEVTICGVPIDDYLANEVSVNA